MGWFMTTTFPVLCLEARPFPFKHYYSASQRRVRALNLFVGGGPSRAPSFMDSLQPPARMRGCPVSLRDTHEPQTAANLYMSDPVLCSVASYAYTRLSTPDTHGSSRTPPSPSMPSKFGDRLIVRGLDPPPIQSHSLISCSPELSGPFLGDIPKLGRFVRFFFRHRYEPEPQPRMPICLYAYRAALISDVALCTHGLAQCRRAKSQEVLGFGNLSLVWTRRCFISGTLGAGLCRNAQIFFSFDNVGV